MAASRPSSGLSALFGRPHHSTPRYACQGIRNEPHQRIRAEQQQGIRLNVGSSHAHQHALAGDSAYLPGETYLPGELVAAWQGGGQVATGGDSHPERKTKDRLAVQPPPRAKTTRAKKRTDKKIPRTGFGARDEIENVILSN
jgi:hypothetical protein